MANLLIFLCLVIGLYYISSAPIPTSYPKQKEIKPESELRFGYEMSFQYHEQMLHGLNHCNLLVGLEIPDLRIPNYCYIVGLGLNCKFIDLLFKRSVLKFIKISSFIVSWFQKLFTVRQTHSQKN